MLLSERFRQKRSQEWVAALRPASVPISAVRTVPAVLADPQVLARDMIVTVDHPKIGELASAGHSLQVLRHTRQRAAAPATAG